MVNTFPTTQIPQQAKSFKAELVPANCFTLNKDPPFYPSGAAPGGHNKYVNFESADWTGHGCLSLSLDSRVRKAQIRMPYNTALIGSIWLNRQNSSADFP
jgi:hypothetical protein